MHFIYGLAEGNSLKASTRYAENANVIVVANIKLEHKTSVLKNPLQLHVNHISILEKQALLLRDFPNRLAFLKWMLVMNRDFQEQVLFMDETNFLESRLFIISLTPCQLIKIIML